MTSYHGAMTAHYSRAGLGAAILAALRKAGKDTNNLTRNDLKAIDEFHTRGLDATIELAKLAAVKPGMKIVDLGCGIGGPARALADEFGCEVTGIDIVEEYCEAASMLTASVKLDNRVRFQAADMMEPGFPDGTFDLAWSQHALMNIEDKPKLFSQIRRMLRPGGRYACYEICAGPADPVYFPVPWASDSRINYLTSPEELQSEVVKAGFEEIAWKEVTAQSLEWFRAMVGKAKSRPADVPPPPGLNLLMGENIGEKLMNIVRNLEESRIRVVQGVFDKSGE